MDIDFIGGKKFALAIPHHIDKDLEDFREDLKGNVVNPGTSKLFTINNEANYLMKKGSSITTQ